MAAGSEEHIRVFLWNCCMPDDIKCRNSYVQPIQSKMTLFVQHFMTNISIKDWKHKSPTAADVISDIIHQRDANSLLGSRLNDPPSSEIQITALGSSYSKFAAPWNGINGETCQSLDQTRTDIKSEERFINLTEETQSIGDRVISPQIPLSPLGLWFLPVPISSWSADKSVFSEGLERTEVKIAYPCSWSKVLL